MDQSEEVHERGTVVDVLKLRDDGEVEAVIREVAATQQRRPQVCLLLASSVSDVVARGRVSVCVCLFLSSRKNSANTKV